MNKKLAIAALAAATFVAATSAKAAVVFDSATAFETSAPGVTISATSSTPNTFMGTGYTLLSGTSDITGFDLFPVNLSGTNFTGLKINIFVWGSVNTTGTGNAFSNLLASYSLTSAGTYTSGFFYNFESATPGVTPGISLTNPLALSGNIIGLTFNYQGTTDGSTYSNVNGLNSLITYGTSAGANPATIGSETLGSAYYRNASNETNGNFLASSVRSLGGTFNDTLAVRVYGDVAAVPEPTSMALLLPAGLLLGRRRRA